MAAHNWSNGERGTEQTVLGHHETTSRSKTNQVDFHENERLLEKRVLGGGYLIIYS